jgi:beta-xylosidase
MHGRTLWRGLLLTACGSALTLAASVVAPKSPWVPDQGDGTFRNPVLHADYSDPDVVRRGDDYYMVSSSFNCAPGLPVLHSRDLVNWRIINHALKRQVPEDVFKTLQHGKGCWAPSFRFHDGRFWIYYPDPDFGIYVVTAPDPAGEWSAPILVKAGKGLIDPCPLWDDDGQLYLVHAWAKSRAGFNNVLTVVKLSADGTRAIDEGRRVIGGADFPGYTTLEGPKFYKRGGYYYIFAPAGGVKDGWQSVFRSRSIYGSYEARIVLERGATAINGPHQGAWVDTPKGEDWFLHFQDKDAYGRVVHLQPMEWKDDWPVIGADQDGDGKGEPVLTFRKPATKDASGRFEPQTSDEFDRPSLGLQWQWQANPSDKWWSLSMKPGSLRLFSQPAPADSLWLVPNLLLQKFPAPEFVATARLAPGSLRTDESAGLVVFGLDYAWIGVTRTGKQTRLSVRENRDARAGGGEKETGFADLPGPFVYLRVTVQEGGRCQFSYGPDNLKFTPLGPVFTAAPGQWIGAKVGLFASAPTGATRAGYVDADWFRVTGSIW